MGAQVGQLIEHLPERLQIAMMGCSARGDVAVRIHTHPVDMMPSVMGELGEERRLHTAVPLAERMQGIDVSEELGQFGNKRGAGQAPRV